MNLETLVMQITTACPHDCPFCYMTRTGENIDLEKALWYIDYAASCGAKAVQFTGGEPVLYPHLSTLISRCRENGMYSMIATSGSGGTKQHYLDLKNIGLTAVCLSLNSIEKSVNLLTRSHYECTLKALDSALSAQLACFVNVAVSPENLPTLEKTVEYLKQSGVTGVCILKTFQNHKGETPSQMTDSDYKALSVFTENHRGFVRVENCYKEYWEYITGEKFVCEDCGNKALFINADGTVAPCSKMSRYKYRDVNELMKDADGWRRHSCGCKL